MITLEIEGLEHTGTGEVEGWLVGQGRRALEEVARRFSLRGEVRVRIVRDDEMTALHARTVGINETTDVLTFDFLDDDAAKGGLIDADIVVCSDEASRQATLRGHTIEKELLLYIVHGVLHCIPGFDDIAEADAQRMHATEDEILRVLGVGAIYER